MSASQYTLFNWPHSGQDFATECGSGLSLGGGDLHGDNNDHHSDRSNEIETYDDFVEHVALLFL